MMLTVRQVSDIGQLSEDLIRDEIEKGRLNAFKIGRAVRIRKDDWEAYLLQNRIIPRQVQSANDNRKSQSHREAVEKLNSILGR